MSQYTSYYLYQKYEKRGDQPFIPSYPQVYSIDGDGTMPLSVKNDNDANCGYTGDTPTTQYRWVNLPISQDYVCDDCPEAQYRWVETSGYICNGTTKYNREVQQVSEDGGQTWTNTSNYRQGSTVIEYNSEDCGYTGDTPTVQYRWVETSGYVCISTIKYTKEIQQVSYDGGQTWEDTSNFRQGSRVIEYDSADCGYVERWVETSGYICNGTTKYNREMKQISEDGGDTWIDTSNYRQGSTVIEYNSEDCGYTPDTGDTSPYASQYFTIESLEDDNYIYWRYTNDNYKKKISASTDGGQTWIEYQPSDFNEIAKLNTNEKLLVKGYHANFTGSYDSYGNYFSSTRRFNVYGNILSLVAGSNFQNASLVEKTDFAHLFSGCTLLISAENLVLPRTTIHSCYYGMFKGCTNLTTAPKLPATTLANGCYKGMFRNCSSLREAPTLPATTLEIACYEAMFAGCTSLTTAPQLLATTLAYNCYYGMFASCTSLTTAPQLRATTLATACYQYMFEFCTSLTTAPQLPATTLADSCYDGMFWNCTSLTTAPQLPATTLAEHCYQQMFQDCTSLTTAPALRATTLVSHCYYGMFWNCTSLTTAPALPATALAERCYYGMFTKCSSLTTAPELRATTLVKGCYESMFQLCSSLNYIKMFATDISAENCLYNWVNGVSSSGTFVKNSAATWNVSGDNGIPSGWTVQIVII